MNEFKTIEQVWSALDQGKTVYWANTNYKIYIEPVVYPLDHSSGIYQRKHFAHRDGQILSARCISNYFGSLLDKQDLYQLFTKKEV